MKPREASAYASCDAGSAVRRAARREPFEGREQGAFVRSRGLRQDEPRGAGVDHDRDLVARVELRDQQAEGALQEGQFVRLVHRARDVDQKDEVRPRAVRPIDRLSLQRDPHEPVRGAPGRRGDVRAHREGRIARGARVVVGKIIDELLDSNGAFRRPLALLEEAAHERVRRRVDVDRERRARIGRDVDERVFIGGRVRLRVRLGQRGLRGPELAASAHFRFSSTKAFAPPRALLAGDRAWRRPSPPRALRAAPPRFAGREYLLDLLFLRVAFVASRPLLSGGASAAGPNDLHRAAAATSVAAAVKAPSFASRRRSGMRRGFGRVILSRFGFAASSTAFFCASESAPGPFFSSPSRSSPATSRIPSTSARSSGSASIAASTFLASSASSSPRAYESRRSSSFEKLIASPFWRCFLPSRRARAAI